MTSKRGFTLIEIIVVLVIVAILAAIAVPSYITFIEQGATEAAQNNLLTIYGAQRNYYFNNNGNYCGPNCDSLTDINKYLSLNLTDNYYQYSCAFPNYYTGATYTCTGTAPSYFPFSGIVPSPNYPHLGINDLTKANTLNCGALLASMGYSDHGTGCSITQSTCPNGSTYAGQTFDCLSCCSN